MDPLVYNMSIEDPGDVSYSEIGGLGEQIRELREVQQMHHSCLQLALNSAADQLTVPFGTFRNLEHYCT